ncbi:hypothetical protein K493DRAFT_295994 [Basidiobolus meristosporus CBS 931.73]|uniref:G-protein coupled receptors family 1 profile domain-containing protein n=1 Tax=Basidiobolus meristosporus CBS 931.73 TaxID=1314790 RepID=A0A1Y1Z8N5_9FUNG|nr:hypothetical protein K493DRAFT_295994 [Basidiobolus meristosporus CBS 931.73]|eukprot:ORY06464.1 hypothetical protein K493DRAFT_295994 [Basidiobolus meristosporus CBS 931.73]
MLLIPVVAFMHAISATCSLFVLICMAVIRHHRKSLTNRISFRLTACYTFFVFHRHLLKFIRISISLKDSSSKDSLEILLQDNYLKSPVFWVTVLSENLLLITVLYTLAITINLQLVLLHNVRSVLNYQLAYIIPPPAIACGVLVVSIISGLMSPEYWNVQTYITMTIFLSTLIYTLVLSVVIVKKLFSTIRKFSIIIQTPIPFQSEPHILNTPSSGGHEAVKPSFKNRASYLTNRTIQRAVTRILLYPLALTLVGLPVFIIRIMDFFLPQSGIDLDAVEYSMTLQGAFNAIAFLFDPTLHAALNCLNSHLLASYSERLNQDSSRGSFGSKSESVSSLAHVKQLFAACYIHWFVLRKNDHAEASTDQKSTSNSAGSRNASGSKHKMEEWDLIKVTYSMDLLNIDKSLTEMDFVTKVNTALEQIQVGMENFERNKGSLDLL